MRDLLEKIDKIMLTEWEEELRQLAIKTAKSNPSLQDLKAAEKAATDDITSYWVNDASMIGNLYGIMAKYYKQPFLFHADGSGRATLAKTMKDNPDMYQVIANGANEKDAESVAKFQQGKGILHPKLEKKFNLHFATSKVSNRERDKIDAYEPNDVAPTTVKSGKGSGPVPGKLQKNWSVQDLKGLTADNQNLGSLINQYHRILQKYNGLGLDKNFDMTRDSNQFVGKNMLKEATKSDVANDLKMLNAIRAAIQRGLDNNTLPKSSSRTHVNNILQGQSTHTAMLRKAAGSNPDQAVAQTPSQKTATDLAIGQQLPGDATTLAAKRNDATPPTSQNITGDATTLALGQQTANDQGAADSNGDGAQSISGQLATKQQPITPDNILLQTGEFIKVLNQLEKEKKLEIVYMLQNKIPELGSAPKAQTQQGRPNAQQKGVPGGLPGNQQTIRALQGTTDKTNPQPYDALKSWQQSDAGVNHFDSTDFNDLLRLAGTQKLTEASMNISMTGNTSSEVRELMDILKNAGMDGAMPVKDLDMFKSTDEPAPCPHCAAMHGMDSPCGEAVEEEWDNSPDEQYQDDEYMMHDLSGGINRKKERAAQRVKDPAVAYESKFKSMLKSSLEEMYQKIKGQ